MLTFPEAVPLQQQHSAVHLKFPCKVMQKNSTNPLRENAYKSIINQASDPAKPQESDLSRHSSKEDYEGQGARETVGTTSTQRAAN